MKSPVILSLLVLALVANAQEPKPLRAGVIGLDTSHVLAFTTTLNKGAKKPEDAAKFAGVKVVAAYPQGSKDIESSTKRVPEYTAKVKELGVDVVDSIDELVKRVDVVFLESNDGRVHFEQLKPVLAAGKPVFIDSLLMGEIARRAEEQLGPRALFAPLMWLGNSHHHMDFPGTLSAEPRAYLNLLCGLLENFIAHGFKRLIILNGHGGNDVPGRQAVFEVRQRHCGRHDLLLLFATCWHLGTQPHIENPALKQTQMGHACEWETSMVLHLAPHIVKDHRNAPAVPFGNAFEPATRGWTMRDRSEPGHIGDPREASADKGAALFSMFTRDAVAMIERMSAWDGASWEG